MTVCAVIPNARSFFRASISEKIARRDLLFIHALTILVLIPPAFSQTAQTPDRNAFTFTRYQLQVNFGSRIEADTAIPDASVLTARGTVTLRNDSATPQSAVAMQLGAQLKWASIKIAGTPVSFETSRLASDIDHTGFVTEATFALAQPVAPKATVDIEVGYSGKVTLDTSRLTAIGVPPAQARASDWDLISPDLVMLRGVGHVAWYPVALDPALLTDANKLFVELGAFRARHADSSMRLQTHFGSTNGVFVLGNVNALTFESGRNNYTNFDFPRVGMDGPLVVIGTFEPLTTPQALIYSQPKQTVLAAKYADAAKKVTPEIALWLRAPQQPITVIQHPYSNAAPFASGTLLLTPFINSDKGIQQQLAFTLAHSAVPSSRAWISEGLAHYAQLREREVQEGRKATITFLLDRLSALSLDEPGNAKSSADSAARSLINTGDEVLYRTKAMYVWWMLHEMLGDDALTKALHNYRQADDKDATYMQKLLEAQSHRDLGWFFDDWVYRDRGLPDFRITQVYPRKTLGTGAAGDAAGYIVTVTVENLGDCSAEVPIRLLTKEGEVTTRLQVPAKSSASARVNTLSPPLEAVVNDGGVPESDLNNNLWKPEAPK